MGSVERRSLRQSRPQKARVRVPPVDFVTHCLRCECSTFSRRSNVLSVTVVLFRPQRLLSTESVSEHDCTLSYQCRATTARTATTSTGPLCVVFPLQRLCVNSVAEASAYYRDVSSQDSAVHRRAARPGRKEGLGHYAGTI